jgi:DNA-binding beta-propeller fold protein YncE
MDRMTPRRVVRASTYGEALALPVGATVVATVVLLVFLVASPVTTLLASTPHSTLKASEQQQGLREIRPIAPLATAPAVSQELQHSLLTTQLHSAGGGYPYSTALVAYASWVKSYYVAVPPSTVDAITATNRTVTAIGVGHGPYGVAVDRSAKEVFVTNTAPTMSRSSRRSLSVSHPALSSGSTRWGSRTMELMGCSTWPTVPPAG